MRKLLFLLFLLPLNLWGAAGNTNVVGLEIETNGYILRVTLGGNTSDSFGTNVGFFNGFGANNVVGLTPKLKLYVSSQGYNDDASTNITGEFIYGTALLRLPYPLYNTNDCKALNSTGTNIVARIALSEFVYVGDSVTASGLAGYIVNTNSAVDAAAFSGITVTNSSTLFHPKSVANWSCVPYQAYSNTMKLSVVAFHKSGREFRPVRCVKFIATDQHSHFVTNIETRPKIDKTQGDANPIIEYTSELDISSFTSGDLITNHFVVYPWKGDVNGTLDTTDFVNGTETPYWRYILNYCNNNGIYGRAWAVVSTTNSSSTGVVTTNGTYGAAFASISQAARALADTNNAYGFNEAVGVIWLRYGDHSFVGTAATPPATRPKAWLQITNLDGRDGCRIINGTGNGDIQDRIACRGITIAANEAFTFSSCSNLWFDKCVIAVTNSTQDLVDGTGFHFVTQCISSNFDQGFRQQGGAQNTTFALVRGNYIRGMLPYIHPYCAIGNDLLCTNVSGGLIGSTLSGLPFPAQMEIVAFNSFLGILYTGATISSFYNSSQNVTNGAAFVQNIYECVGTNQPGTLDFVMADSTTGFGTNIIYWYNTILGERFSYAYDSLNTVAHYRQQWSVKNNYWDDANTKHDTFTADTDGAQGARIGGFSVLYGVGHSGNFNCESTNVVAGGSFLLQFPGLNCYQPPITSGNPQPPTCTANVFDYAKFVANKTVVDWHNGTNPAGGGTYRYFSHSPTTFNPDSDRLLPFDGSGNSRTGIDPAGFFNHGSNKRSF